MIWLPWFILGLNVGGYLLGKMIGDFRNLGQYLTIEGGGALLQQLFTGVLCGFIIISINNIILTKPRAMLKIYYPDKNTVKKA